MSFKVGDRVHYEKACRLRHQVFQVVPLVRLYPDERGDTRIVQVVGNEFAGESYVVDSADCLPVAR